MLHEKQKITSNYLTVHLNWSHFFHCRSGSFWCRTVTLLTKISSGKRVWHVVEHFLKAQLAWVPGFNFFGTSFLVVSISALWLQLLVLYVQWMRFTVNLLFKSVLEIVGSSKKPSLLALNSAFRPLRFWEHGNSINFVTSWCYSFAEFIC